MQVPLTASLTLNGTIDEIKAFLGGSGTVQTGTGAGTTTGGTGTTTVSGGTSTVSGGGTPIPVTGNQQNIQVGPSRQFAEPADAAGSLAAGGTLVLDDGVYKKAFHAGAINMKSASGNPFKCYFDGQGGNGAGHRLAWSKGMVHLDGSTGDSVIDGIGFRNCGSPASGDNYSNEAGIWLGDSDGTKAWKVTVRRCAFDNNANGVFTGSEAKLTVTETECIFGYIAPNGMNAYANGTGGHPAHDNYLECDNVEVSGSYFYGSVGHNVKLRSAAWNVHDNPVMTQDGGRVIDAADGGKGQILNNTMFTRTDRQGQMVGSAAGRFGNSNLIGYALESSGKGVADVAITGNTMHISRPSSTVAFATGTKGVANGNTVKFYGQGSLQVQGNVAGLSAGSAPPGSPAAAPPLPPPPAWATP